MCSSDLLDLPAELIVLALSHSNIQEVHSFQLVCHAADIVCKSHHASIYRALAVHYDLAQETQTLEQLLASRRLYFDWLKQPTVDSEEGSALEEASLVESWQDYVKCHFLLERNWKDGKYVVRPRFDANGAHRIQIDEVEGTILSTRTTGSLRSECIKDDVTLWTHFQFATPAWAHCEFDNGFLIWGRRDRTIEVWRRDADQINDPLPACNPHDDQRMQYTQSQKQVLEAMEDLPSDSDTSESDSLAKPKQATDLVAPIRGCFQPFGLLDPPTSTSASRYVHPHLVLATRLLETVYVYDIPNNRLAQTISLEPADDGRPSTVYYVEHSRTHVFICTEDAVHVYSKADGKLYATVRTDIVPDLWLVVPRVPIWPSKSVGIEETQRERLIAVNPAQTRPHASGEFCAVHVSPCGNIWVIMNERNYILVIIGGNEDPTRMRVATIVLNDPELVYLAFDGHHIAVAGSQGIHVVSLDRYRDPTVDSERTLTRLIKSHVLLIPMKHVDMRSTSCLQLTDTAIWHVARKSLREFGSVITSLDFASIKV